MSPTEYAAAALAAPLDHRSVDLRRLIVAGMLGGGRGHPGPALSLVEILRVLYDDVMRVRPDHPDWPDRDRCILSKGHGCLALYAILADKGFFPAGLLDAAGKAGNILGGHPERGKIPGVEASTGALGHGLPIGVGMALAARMQKRPSRVFVVMGDGEINEGSVWEAALCAAKHRLGNLTAIVDYNKFQSYGPTSTVLDLEPLADKWRAFGFAVREANGHDVADVRRALGAAVEGASPSSVPDRPTAVICHTVKGKGVPVAENNAKWHHLSRLSREQTEAMKSAVGLS